MPTDLPSRQGALNLRKPLARSGVRVPCGPLRQPRPGFWRTVTFLVMVARREWLNRRMTRLTARLAARPSERDEARLRAGARAWLRYTERISALAGIPEPEETAELRAIFHAGPPACGQAHAPSVRPVTKD